MEEAKKTKVLLLEPNRNLCLATMFALESRFNFHVIDCHTIGVAERMLEINSDIRCVIFPASVGAESAEPLYKHLLENLPAIPIICTDLEACSNWEIIPEMAFPKKAMLSTLLDTIEERFEVDSSLPPEKYTQVSLKTLSFVEALADDVFIQLQSGRLVKLFSIGDRIDEEDVERYGRKGVQYLFLDRKACLWILKVVNKSIENLILDEHFQVNLSESEELDQSNDARELFGEVEEDEYVSNVFHQEEEFVQEVHQQTQNVVNNIKQNRDLMKLLAKIKFEKGEGAFVKNRMKLVSGLSCAISRAMGWDSDQTFEKLIYCAHLHDIMLLDSPVLAKMKYLAEADMALEMGKITESDRERFYKHTLHAAELISLDPMAPPDAATIVQQHHELPGGDGFPAKMVGLRINAFAAILAVSIDLAQYILTNKERDFNRYIDENKNRFKGGSFTKVMKSLAELTGAKY